MPIGILRYVDLLFIRGNFGLVQISKHINFFLPMVQKKYFKFGTFLLLSFCFSCKKQFYTSRLHDFPTYVDTESKPIKAQEKKVYNTPQGVSASNNFNGARLNDFMVVNDSTFKATIEPENTPINPSPWYAFKLWSESPKTIYLTIHYENGKHRYSPKFSENGLSWQDMDTTRIRRLGNDVQLELNLTKDTLWLAGQELFSTNHLQNWLDQLKSENREVKVQSYGKSKLGRNLYTVSLYPSTRKNKELIVLMSRQHPPEITGQRAFLHFVDRLLQNDSLTRTFKEKYQVILFPMQNPDGVDLGHWRHNAGGIDLNRDWDKYNQPETRQMAEYVIHYANQHQSKVILGLDFHSTWDDVYYTNRSDTATAYPNFTSTWLKEIKKAIPGYEPNVEPSNIGQPVSKGWFFVTFNAVGITYEIGDRTDRDFIKTKSRIAAEKMMETLLQTK